MRTRVRLGRGIGFEGSAGFVSALTATLVAMAVGGCGESRQGAWDTTPTASNGAVEQSSTSHHDELVAAGEAAWAQRDELAQVDTAIQQFQAAVEAEPGDHESWVKLSRALYFKSDCHLRFQDGADEQFLASFEQGTQAAEHALVALSADFGERMRAGTRIEEAVDTLDASAVPALYWRSSNLGKWASAKGFATLLSYKDEIRAIMQRCLDLDPTYNHYGPDRYFGVFYGRAPSFAGGDLEQSREHFETSMEHEPNYFATHVLMAQDYAIKAQDRALFDQQLQWVLSHDPESMPELAPENRCEQRKARELLENADEHFE